jgi:purine-binding chemotaxis protein CheW
VPDAPSADMLEIAALALANERYAIETRYVREIVKLTDLTPIPGAPAFLAGIMNLRGEILAVVDLRGFFGVPVKGVTDLSRVVVVGEERAEFGVLVDEGRQVVRLRVDQVLEPPGSVAGIGREYLRGVTEDGLIVLDGSVLVRDRRLLIDEADETIP